MSPARRTRVPILAATARTFARGCPRPPSSGNHRQCRLIATRLLKWARSHRAARTLEGSPLEIRHARDIAPAFAKLGTQTQALYIAVDGLVASNRTRIFLLAAGARLPSIVNTREHAEAGALISYGPSFPALFRRAAEYVNKILRGSQACRVAGGAANKIRSNRQPGHGESNRSGTARDVARPRRRSD